VLDAARRSAAVLRRDGWRVVAADLLDRASASMRNTSQPLRTDARRQDLLAPQGATSPPTAGPGRTWTLNWVINPPSELSGGMGTLMKAVSLLEDRGHTCRLFVLYKGTRRAVERDQSVARARFPSVRAELHDVDDGMPAADGIVATAWPTAYTVRASSASGARFYFVQDFEPWFYAASSNASLAEETYRFGFHGVTAGPWLTQKLSREYDMTSDAFDLGVDVDCYRLGATSGRAGVVFYARPGTPRRGTELGMMALELFAREHPEVDIHVVGESLNWRRSTFRFVDHGLLTPEALAALYRRCSAGLVLSLSNLSLLPAELLACGCIPVMNDAEFTRVSCPSPFARFARATPQALADALADIARHEPGDDVRRAAAESVEASSWDAVGDQLEAAFRRGLALALG
jgi:hypothetical protein